MSADDVEAGQPKVARLRGILLGPWVKDLKPGDHVVTKRKACGCATVHVNDLVVHRVGCSRHKAQLRRKALSMAKNESMKITFLVECLRLAKRHGVDVELDTAKGSVNFRRRSSAKTTVVWQPVSNMQLHVREG